MKKIIHLTDTHIGYQDLSTTLGDMVTRIIFTKEEASNYVIVHTGDVVEDATRDGSYEEALAHFNRLRHAVGWIQWRKSCTGMIACGQKGSLAKTS